MNKRILLYFATALLTAGCSSEADLATNSPSGEGKTPLTITATLTTARPGTRAEGKDFASGDKIDVYLQHMATADNVAPDFSKTVTFTKGTDAMTADGDNKNKTDDFSANVYWEDFSNSSSPEKDIRTDGHGLRALYAYCYNGGEANKVSLTQTTGELNWKVGTIVDASVDQNSAAAIKTADLLWAPTSALVPHNHNTAHKNVDHGTVNLDFTHAMSMVTVTIVADEGFVPNQEESYAGVENPLNSTKVTLRNVNTTATLNGATATPTSSNSSSSIIMYDGGAGSYPGTNQYQRNYTAIIAPGTTFKESTKLLDLTGIDGNDYTVSVTANMLAATDNHWGTGHTITEDGEGKKSIVTKPGYNYHLTVTVKKTSIQTSTTLADWKEVTAEADGHIVFNDDDVNLVMDDSEISGTEPVEVVAVDRNKFVSGATFSLFTLKHSDTADEGTERTNAAYTYSTVPQFKNPDATEANDVWENTPKLFWENANDKYYFRALAKFNSAENEVNDISSVQTWTTGLKGTDLQAVSQGSVAEGHDILWGTTAKHKGIKLSDNSSEIIYEAGQAIPPRTGGVPIAFKHAMSKVSFILKTTDDEARVNLSQAKISISNLYTTGAINIEDGTVDWGTLIGSDAITGTAAESDGTLVEVISGLIVIPQTFNTTDTKVTITLDNGNGARYTLPLKDCLVTNDAVTDQSNGSYLTEWKQGRQYTYTIHIEKEKIQFRALVKDWDAPVNVSGEANLEWD